MAGCTKSGREPAAEDRILRLERQVEPQRKASAQAVDAYAPKLAVRLDDLNVPTAELLRQLPGVADVEVLVRVDKPTHRIIHLRDWHYVPKDLFRQDADRTPSSRPVAVGEDAADGFALHGFAGVGPVAAQGH
jgi:hypothetical protein